jgi:hypothetical protein
MVKNCPKNGEKCLKGEKLPKKGIKYSPEKFYYFYVDFLLFIYCGVQLRGRVFLPIKPTSLERLYC